MDHHDIYALLHIAEKASQWPKLKPLHDWALEQLESHAQLLKQGKAASAQAVAKPAEEDDEDEDGDEE